MHNPSLSSSNQPSPTHGGGLNASTTLEAACKKALDWLNDFGANSPIEFGGEQELHDQLHAALDASESENAALAARVAELEAALEETADELELQMGSNYGVVRDARKVLAGAK